MKPIGLLVTILVVLGCSAPDARADTYPYHHWNRPWAEAMLIRSQLKQIPVFSGKILDARCGGIGDDALFGARREGLSGLLVSFPLVQKRL